MMEVFDGLFETDGDEQAEDDGGDVDEEVAPGAGSVVGGWTSSMGAFSFVGFGTCAVCGTSHSWADANVTPLAAVTSASGSSFGDSGVSGMQFLLGFVPLDYQRFAGAPKELGGKRGYRKLRRSGGRRCR